MSREHRSLATVSRLALIIAGVTILAGCGGGSSSTPTSTSPAVTLSATTLTFTSQGVNTTSPGQMVTVTNSGTATLNISGIAVGGTNSADFGETSTCGTTLAAGSNCPVTVTFTPKAAGTRTGTLSITDDASGSPQTVALTGTGSSVSLSASSLSFSGVTAGTTSSPQSATLTNSSSTALAISSVAISGTNSSDFALVSGNNACPYSGGNVAANGTCVLYVTFSSATNGTFTATLTVTDNASGTAGSTQTVSLSGSTSLTNTAAVSVNFGPEGQAGGYYDGIFTTVTVCQPGTTTCVSVPNVLVDTGSVGLRVLSSALTGVTLSQVTDGSGNYLYECTQYGDGSFNWGPVSVATIQIGGESASQVPTASGGTANSGVPIEIISTAAVPSVVTGSGQCMASSSTPDDDTVATLGSNGILGIGNEATDCALAGTNYCDNSTLLSSITEPYWLCDSGGSTCSSSTFLVPDQYQVWNPVAAFSSSDTNGVVVQLASIPAAGQATADGQIIFGIGTQSNNAISGTVYGLDTMDSFGSLVFNGVTYSSTNSGGAFLDTGSNAYYVSDPATLTSATGVSTLTCPSTDVGAGFYCPSSTLNLNITVNGSNGTSTPETISIENADSLFTANPGNAALNDLGGTSGGTNAATDSWDLGLPFFFGRSVFIGIAGTNSTYPNGYYAF